MNPHDPHLKLAFGILGNIIGVGVSLAPMPTFWNIYKKKDTQGFSGLPYVFSLVSGLIWVLYSLPMVTKDAFLVITINVAGSALQIFYLSIYLRYAAQKPRRHLMKVVIPCLVFCATLTVLTLTVVPPHLRSITVGSVVVVIGVVTYASPLSITRTVIRTRSVEFVPIILCIFWFINSTIWSCYGIITIDVFVMIPNGLGVIFGVAQLSLYAIYRNVKPLDGFSNKGKIQDASMVTMTIIDEESVGKSGGKQAKIDENVQLTTLPLQGENKENPQPPFIPLQEAPSIAVVV